ncbi:MAG: TetR/AcrR family transcriptional regulator [Spirochaetales bacterium]|nr:TetR/AcrR family transcriptional regulator [Spirochaetales bacterium]
MSEYHHGNLKQQLLDEGLKLLGEEGIEKFSLRKLAKRCGVSHTSPYRHFASKEELILAVAQEIQSRFNTALKEGLASVEGSPKEKMKAMGKAYVHFFAAHPDYLDLLFLTPEIYEMAPEKHNHKKADSSLMTYLSAVLPLAEAKGGGLTIPENPTSPDEMQTIPGAALQPWCLIHGLTVLIVKKALPVKSPEALDQLVEDVLSKGYY